MASKHDRAREWRENRQLSVNALAEKLGYAPETVYVMERGTLMRDGSVVKVNPWVFQRYQYACAGLDAELRTGRAFEW